jgi:hypothetical protein
MIKVRMIGAWFMHPEAYKFTKWIEEHRDLTVWDKFDGVSWINGREYPAVISFTTSEALLLCKLQFSELLAHVVD